MGKFDEVTKMIEKKRTDEEIVNALDVTHECVQFIRQSHTANLIAEMQLAVNKQLFMYIQEQRWQDEFLRGPMSALLRDFGVFLQIVAAGFDQEASHTAKIQEIIRQRDRFAEVLESMNLLEEVSDE